VPSLQIMRPMISAGVAIVQSGSSMVLWKSTHVMYAPGGQVRLYGDPLVTSTPIGGRLSTDWHPPAAWKQAECTGSLSTINTLNVGLHATEALCSTLNNHGVCKLTLPPGSGWRLAQEQLQSPVCRLVTSELATVAIEQLNLSQYCSRVNALTKLLSREWGCLYTGKSNWCPVGMHCKHAATDAEQSHDCSFDSSTAHPLQLSLSPAVVESM
jgi:hypothetical protein